MGRTSKVQLIFWKIVLVAFFSAFAWLGVHGISELLEDRRLAHASVDWPKVEGTITSSRIERDGDGHEAAAIAYRYEVEGREYRSGRVAFHSKGFASADDVVERFPRRKAVTVYYEPRDPSVAVLEPGATSSGFLGRLAIGMIFVLIGLVGAVGCGFMRVRSE